jgi:hypothetical protein
MPFLALIRRVLICFSLFFSLEYIQSGESGTRLRFRVVLILSYVGKIDLNPDYQRGTYNPLPYPPPSELTNSE